MEIDRQQAHQLLDQLDPGKFDAVARLLAVLATDPHPPKYPYDDEPFTEAERRAVAEAEEGMKHNEPIPLETVLADFGLTMADWEEMANTPLPEETQA